MAIEKSSRRVTVIKQYRKFSGLIEGSETRWRRGEADLKSMQLGFGYVVREWLEPAKLKFLAATRV